MRISLRLDDEMAKKLGTLAKAQGISRSELIRQRLAEYVRGSEDAPNAWELGKHLFGCYHSGQTDRSDRVQEIARERIRTRRSRR